jgi:MFS family permease
MLSLSLVPTVLLMLMSQKERGKRMALTNLSVFGGAFFTPILVGKITHTIGWPWSFYFVAIFSAASLPLVFFFVPETAYRRSAHLNTDLASSDDVRLYHKQSEPDHQLPESRGVGDLGETRRKKALYRCWRRLMAGNQMKVTGNYSSALFPYLAIPLFFGPVSFKGP